MRCLPKLTLVVALLPFLTGRGSLAQTNDHSADDRKIIVDSFVISGTQTIDSAELAEIMNSMSGSTFNDDAEELGERIRAQFQDHGYFKMYFKMEMQKLDIKVLDPLASPKPVRLEAQVSEGARFRLSRIEFTGTHAVSSPELRAKFPLKTGDKFARSKVTAGLDGIRQLYASRGFLDFVCIPETKFDSGSSVNLSIEVQEGPQYRMGNLEILGPTEIAEKLEVQWELTPGAVFNAGYVETFVEKNRSLLPADFTQSNDVEVFTDCRDATVSVHLHLVQDPQHAALDRTKHVDCRSPEEKTKK
jgi:outer membrane protein assembly factor BamA